MNGKVLPLEIVEVNFFFPQDGTYKPHPALVVSTVDLFEDEEIFYGVLMTTKNIFPKYTVFIESAWLTKPASRPGYFATHLVQIFTMDDVLRKTNTFLKAPYYEPIRQKLITSILHHG